MRWTRSFMLAVGISMAALGCKHKNNSSTGDIIIGEFASTSGGTATFGQSSNNGLQLAIEQANANGGVLGRKLKIVLEDDGSDVNQAVSAVQKLINQDNAVAIIGEVASKRSLAGATICSKFKVPMLSPASTNPAVTFENGQVKPWIFRICFTDDFQGRADAQFALDKGWKRVAIFTQVDEDYSKGLARVFKEYFGAHGGTIVADESYRGSDQDYQSQLTRLAETKPDAIYVPGYYGEVNNILKQAAGMGMKLPFFGGDGWDSDQTLKNPAAQGMYYSDHYTADDPAPEVQKFVKAYQSKYGTTPDAMAVLGYDAGQVMVDAIKRAGKADPTAIRDALATEVFDGASGKITIDSEHNARKPIVVLQVKDHKAVLEKTYTPDEVEKAK